jgi:hypothetical protein
MIGLHKVGRSHFLSRIISILAVVIWPTISLAQTKCSIALVLALDVSGSVDDDEYRLQMNGIATALLTPKVQALILSQPNAPVSLSIFEWSSASHQELILNWTKLTSPATLEAIAGRLRNYRKDRATQKTAIGPALRFAKALLDQKHTCVQRTIDISSDGANNDGQSPLEIYEAVNFTGITVNALVIGLEDVADQQNLVVSGRRNLRNYFDTRVIRGPGAFSILAIGYKDYERAIIEKLLKELSPAAVSDGNLRPNTNQRPL